MKCVFKHEDLQMFSLNLNKENISNFHPLEVVDQENYSYKNLNYLIQCFQGLSCIHSNFSMRVASGLLIGWGHFLPCDGW